MSATERGAPLSVTYKRASELASARLHVTGVNHLATLGVDQVLVNPEPKRHVGIEQQVSDSTTRHIGVLVCITVRELYECNCVERINLQLSDSVRGTRRNSDEHVVNECKVNESCVLVEQQ